MSAAAASTLTATRVPEFPHVNGNLIRVAVGWSARGYVDSAAPVLIVSVLVTGHVRREQLGWLVWRLLLLFHCPSLVLDVDLA